MRAAFGRYFDVIVVVWALTLGMCWTVYTVGHAQIGYDHWTAPKSAPAWFVYVDGPTLPPAP
jgi:hypothetical protein